MASRINKRIKEDFQRFEQLLSETKNSDYDLVVLNEVKKQHPNTRQSRQIVKHSSLNERLYLIVESKIEDLRSFKFKLQAPDFTGEPFFRFDSDGPAHLNRSEDTPLHLRKIDTPHFNSFDSKGKSISYRTNSLMNDREREALMKDISLCMAHYCDESQLFNNGNYIRIQQCPNNELGLQLENRNPLEGVDYD